MPIRTTLGVLSFAEGNPLAQRHGCTVTELGANGLGRAYLGPWGFTVRVDGLTDAQVYIYSVKCRRDMLSLGGIWLRSYFLH